MTGRDSDPAELQRRFEELVAGMSLDDLKGLVGQILSFRERNLTTPEQRSSLRKPRRNEAAIFRVRVDLESAKPPIWRRLDVRSDIGLDVFHQVLQSAFGWTDSHLHRFAIGGSPFDKNSELFLCPYDVEEGEDDGTPTKDATLDETLSMPVDLLRYCYDYGDSWDLRIALESVRPLDESAPVAVCIDGRRAAPPEDSGGLRDAADLAEVLEDPAHFDIDEITDCWIASRLPTDDAAGRGVRPAVRSKPWKELNRMRLVAVLAACVIVTGCGNNAGRSTATPGALESVPPSVTPLQPETSTPMPSPTVATPVKSKGTVIKAAKSQFGMMLFDRTGQAIYLFDKEQTTKPECYGACAEAWPPVLTKGTPAAAGGTRQNLLGTTKRTDGTTQATYGGHPLYYYAHEAKNEVKCHNIQEFGGLWLVVTPAGRSAAP